MRDANTVTDKRAGKHMTVFAGVVALLLLGYLVLALVHPERF
jgi:K+-transporting ATPase KdpF subunit